MSRVAVVGSGIAGLVAAFRLGRAGIGATVLESRDRLALCAHSATFDLAGRSYAVDSLLVWPRYHTALGALLTEVGLRMDPRPLPSSSFSESGSGDPYLRYVNRKIGRWTVPLPGGSVSAPWVGLTWLRHYLTCGARSVWDSDRGAAFALGPRARRTVFPWLDAALGFVPADRVAQAPLRGMARFFRATLTDQPHTITAGGLAGLASRLLEPVEQVRLGTRVERVRPGEKGVEVVWTEGGAQREERFDAVILATPPAVCARIAPVAPDVAAELHRFGDVAIPFVAHTDASLMPGRPDRWNALNYRLHADRRSGVELTLWLNPVLGLPKAPPVFLTWNAVRDPPSHHVRYATELVRVLPGLHNQPFLVERLPQIQGAGRVWFAGVWTVPWRNAYLEEGVLSGASAALGVVRAVSAG